MIIDETNIPRYAMFRGRKVQITWYDAENQMFRIIDTDDTFRSVHRSQLTFIKEAKKVADKGFTLDMTIPGMRETVAFTVLKSRLEMSIRFKRTDRYALQAARGWAEKVGYPTPNFRTTKQALAFVKEVLDQMGQARNASE